MILEKLTKLKVVPVITINDAKQANRLADALVEGGLPCAEITLRTKDGIKAIEILSKRTDILVGAGTVLTLKQAQEVKDAGAQFAMAPGLNPKIVKECSALQLPFIPGVCTPSDIEIALDLGLKTVKFFPAEINGGIKAIKQLGAVYGGMNFIPTGGISVQNVKEYLANPHVVACGGSWVAPGEWIDKGDYEKITAIVQSTVQLFH